MVRVSLFQFQDIITCVSGILIIITLMMVTMISEESAVIEITATGEETKKQAEEEQDLKAQNLILQDQLTATADPDFVKAETAALRERLRALATNLEARRSGEAAQAEARKTTQAVADSLAKERAALVAKVEALDKDVQEKQAALLASANAWWLVPKLLPGGKLPILAVVSDKAVTIDELNQPDHRQKLDMARLEEAFTRLSGQYSAALYYFFFYVKPSGIANFVTLKELAQKGGFQVGFDAALENVELNFFKPTK